MTNETVVFLSSGSRMERGLRDDADVLASHSILSARRRPPHGDAGAA